MKNEDTAKSTREFAIRDVMISHCGENLTPDNVDGIAAEILAAIETGPCAWAFRHNADVDLPPLVARLDADFGDMAENYQPHEKYREMRSLAIRLERRLMQAENA